MAKDNFHVYVDESGQDTKGKFFVVGIVIIEKEKLLMAEKLKEIELKSRKNNIKWNKSKHEYRKKYLSEIHKSASFKQKIFFEIFKDKKEYISLTSLAVSKAVRVKANRKINYKATIFLDGFSKTEVRFFSQKIRSLQVRTKKIRGIKKEGSNEFIRLADAICGLIRDADDKKTWAKNFLKKLEQKKIITSL